MPKDLCPGHDIFDGMMNGEMGEAGFTLGTMCGQTGKMATGTCPYITTGLVNPFGGYCIHSYQDGVALFTAEDVADQTANAETYKQAADAQLAAGAEAAAAQAAEDVLNGLGLGGNTGDATPEIPAIPQMTLDPNLIGQVLSQTPVAPTPAGEDE